MNVNVRKLMLSLLPLSLRKSKVLNAFIVSISASLNTSKSSLDAYIEKTNWYAHVTPQVFSLENILNKVINPPFPIQIFDGELVLPFYYRQNQNEMQYYGNIHYADTYSSIYDFIVKVPASLTSSQIDVIKAIITKYKLPSKKFNIELI